MLFASSRRTHASTVVALLSVVSLLAACGISKAPSNVSKVSTKTSTNNTLVSNVSPQPLSFNSAASADLGGLHIQTAGIDCGANVVLSSQQTRYDTGAIQQMNTYLNAFGEAYSFTGATPFTMQLAHKLPPLPSTLRVIPGAADCLSLFDITNTGTRDIQWLGFRATLATSTGANTTSYNLVDACSFPNQSWFCQGRGGEPACGYMATMNLRAGSAGTQSDAPITMYDPRQTGACSIVLTIAPGGDAEVSFTITSTSALLTTIHLSVLLNTSQGKTFLQLPAAFDSALVFATNARFSCYGLQGNAFIKEQQEQNGVYSGLRGTMAACL